MWVYGILCGGQNVRILSLFLLYYLTSIDPLLSTINDILWCCTLHTLDPLSEIPILVLFPSSRFSLNQSVIISCVIEFNRACSSALLFLSEIEPQSHLQFARRLRGLNFLRATMKASPLLISWHNDNTPIYSAHFEPNGKGRLATGGGDNNVRLWKVDRDGEERIVTYLTTLIRVSSRDVFSNLCNC